MRDASTDLDEVLRQSPAVELIVDVFYGDDQRTFPNLPVTQWDLAWDAETATKSDGGLTVAHVDDAGKSLVPTGYTDTLAPYGQEVAVLAKVSFGPIFTETVLLGRFRINAVPNAKDEYFGFQGRPYVAGSVVQLQIGDRLTVTAKDGFRWPAVPTHTDSTWDEVQYLTGLPVDPNLPDQPTPANLVYPPGKSGRLAAVQQLLAYLGGIAVTNSFGELTTIPYDSTDVVNTLTMGTRGTVLDTSSAMDSSTFVNEVVGTYQDDDGNPIYAYAWVSSGPLATDGPVGRSMDDDSSDAVKTPAQARQRVQDVLQQRLQGQTNRITLTVLFDPRAEMGDVVTVLGPVTHDSDGTLSDPAWDVTGRIISIRWQGSTDEGDEQVGLMTIVLDVAADQVAVSISVGP